MSALRIVWPDSDVADGDEFDTEPAVLPFHSERGFARRFTPNVIDRARLFYDNRQCPECDYPVVLPIELHDAVLNRSGLPIPGTATLVGFRCRGCQAEWSV
jgi:hypothetical protein